ncbi:MAG: site-2 protease family protein [Defluviitaleaceae bacterium]|nr:site-2 protease family protein [Defluviitaleaceae bacterium]
MTNMTIAITNIVAPLLAAILVIFLKELSKAVTCASLGDTSIKTDGRLSLNPFKHIEPIGLILLFNFGTLGWGKPVETRQYRYKKPRNAIIISSLVPMLILILLGVLSIFLLAYVVPFPVSPLSYFLVSFLRNVMHFSFGLFVFNLIPLYPFEASRILKLFMPPNQALSFNSNERIYLFVLVLVFFMMPWALNGFFRGVADIIMNFFINLLVF